MLCRDYCFSDFAKDNIGFFFFLKLLLLVMTLQDLLVSLIYVKCIVKFRSRLFAHITAVMEFANLDQLVSSITHHPQLWLDLINNPRIQTQLVLMWLKMEMPMMGISSLCKTLTLSMHITHNL